MEMLVKLARRMTDLMQTKQKVMRETIQRYFPDVDLDSVPEGRMRVYLSSLEYIEADWVKGIAYKRETPLAVHLKYTANPVVIETAGSDLLVLSHPCVDEIMADHFDKATGESVPRKRRWIRLYESSRGKYVVYQRKRYYLPDES
jgi:hypothetical protein